MNRHPAVEFRIREMSASDVQPLRETFSRLGTFERYFNESRSGERYAIVALVGSEYVGHVAVIWRSLYAPFRERGIPEISDLDVLESCRRRGIGTALLSEAEQKIRERSSVAGLSVGLYADYGPAQLMYALRGYVPDANGLYTHYEVAKPGTHVKVDDDLCIYLTKGLGERSTTLRSS